MAGDEEPGSLEPGERLGPWRVRARIGTGGMGEVYAASRADDAYEADVAVKVLKRGLDTVGVVRRFLRERRVLGQPTPERRAPPSRGGPPPTDGRTS